MLCFSIAINKLTIFVAVFVVVYQYSFLLQRMVSFFSLQNDTGHKFGHSICAFSLL